ncbi:methyl-accepting chemotaxis protein [Photobacterium sagamiensis]|uniref:methyl-accepting chemotaxis protein n=1 Tax=Photobacterium sagamiensis TaxID=2910241 RepID=UPI003D101A3C
MSEEFMRSPDPLLNKDNRPSAANAWFSSLRVKLSVIVIASAFAILLLGAQGIIGMNRAAISLETIYSQGMQHMVRSGKLLSSLESIRAQMLLSFQHAPDNEFSTMHDHPAISHVDNIATSLLLLETIVDEINSSDLSDEERNLVNSIQGQVNLISKDGFQPALKAIEKGDYKQANLFLLTRINPAFSQIEELTTDFVEIQIDEAKGSYIEALDKNTKFIWQVGIIVVIAMVIIGSLSGYTIRRLSRAIDSLQNIADKVVSGDLTARNQQTGNDEMSSISQAVNKIVHRFQHTVVETSGAVSQLVTSAEENSVVSAQTSANVLLQQEQIQLIATAIHQMNVTVRDVAQNTAEAASTSELANNAANEGADIVRNTVNTIQTLADEVDRATSAIHDLGENSQEIGGVLDVIRGIAEQTNLLALNAAIEAARAGDQGRGFAVVADEVRTLAKRTQDSTEEIQQMISRLQSGSINAVGMMDLARSQAKESVNNAELSGKSLDDILHAVRLIGEMNTQIATAAEQQSSVTEEINQNITRINDISDQTAAGAEQTSASTRDLAALADHLQEEVNGFKV